MLVDEKRSRLKSEDCIIKLENELLATQMRVTDNYHTGTKKTTKLWANKWVQLMLWIQNI